MSIHPNSLKNLEKRKKFVPRDPRASKGRTSRNRKTIFAEWTDYESKCKDPEGHKILVPLIYKMALAIFTKASRGDISAATMVLDNLYGKLTTQPVPETEKQPIDWSVYTEEELQTLIALLKKGAKGDIIELSYEEEE